MEKTEEKKKSGGLFSKLKNLLVEEVEDTTTKTEDQPKVESSKVIENVFTSPIANVNIGLTPTVGAFDENFYKSIMQSIQDKNLDGIDYLEFIAAKKQMDSVVGLTEPGKFQMVFMTLKSTSNITKEKLMESIDHYTKVIEDEIKEFNEGVAQEVENEVNSRLNQANQKETQAAEKQAQIEKLKEEISQLVGDANVLKVEASNADAKIKTISNNFIVTSDTIKNALKQDKENIQNFIQ